MPEFNSIIIFDTETTGLPQMEHNQTKIAEMAFLGCEVRHLKESQELPRVLHKMVLCFNPNKKIQPGATKTSGLDNELLEGAKPFDEEVVYMLNKFIKRLPQPVCIVAHNGDKFDFPILQRELKERKEDLSKEVYCVDSLRAFQALCRQSNRSKLKPVNFQPCDTPTTPKGQKTNPTNSLHYKSNRGEKNDDDIIPEKVAKKLFEEGEWLKVPSPRYVGNSSSAPKTSSSQYELPKNFKLGELFRFFHNGNDFPNAHRAEDDCKALLSCIINCDGFLDWMNENARPFNEIPYLF